MSSDPVKSAYDHAAQGRLTDAVGLLDEAGEQGNAVALAELAMWYLRGNLVPRDLRRARAVLRRTVTIGHVDAALLEAALTANGTGGTSNWPEATSLLRRAAEGDSVAAQHLALLDAMPLDADGYPIELPPREVLSNSPAIYRFANAISQPECLHLAGAAHANLEPAVVIDPNTGQSMAHPIRNSYGTAIGPAQEDLVVAALNRRIAAMTGTALNNGEPLQVLRYTPGQQYRLHSDALAGTANQRVITAIAYLNQGFGGGETDFPAIGVRVQPRAGDLLVFHNALPDGRMDPRTRHAGLPVTSGVKWIATRWIRAASYDPWNPS
jgi:prolyl 4-hydroxylase